MKPLDRRFSAGSRVAALLAFGFVLTAANGIQPASQRDETPDPIIVAGQDASPDAVRVRAANFIQRTGVASGSTPAARWIDPICPRVLGLQEAGTRAAEARIRAIAAEVGVEVAPAPCTSNIVITFASDAGAIVREIERRSPGRLGELSPTAREALLNGSAPIRWWYGAETRGRHGEGSHRMSSGGGQNTPATHAGSGGGSNFGGDAATVMHYDNSIISTLSQRALVSAGVVIDQDAVMGMRLDNVAAYAALAEIRSSEFSGEGSILNLFAAPNAARGLTTQDRAFLRALYRMPLDREARRHRGLLVGEMVAAGAN